MCQFPAGGCLQRVVSRHCLSEREISKTSGLTLAFLENRNSWNRARLQLRFLAILVTKTYMSGNVIKCVVATVQRQNRVKIYEIRRLDDFCVENTNISVSSTESDKKKPLCKDKFKEM